MRLTLAEHGGLAGGLRLGQPPLVVDLSELTEGDVRELTELVAAVRADPPPDASARSVPDGMSYTVTVDDGREQEVLRRTDSSMTKAYAQLLDRLRELARGG